jgi:hypothetical protein
MLLTIESAAQAVGASANEKAFMYWIARQASVDNDAFTIVDGKTATIGLVKYRLLQGADLTKVRGKCPELGTFLAAQWDTL